MALRGITGPPRRRGACTTFRRGDPFDSGTQSAGSRRLAASRRRAPALLSRFWRLAWIYRAEFVSSKGSLIVFLIGITNGFTPRSWSMIGTLFIRVAMFLPNGLTWNQPHGRLQEWIRLLRK